MSANWCTVPRMALFPTLHLDIYPGSTGPFETIAKSTAERNASLSYWVACAAGRQGDTRPDICGDFADVNEKKP
jgi:hypothetical protein